MNIDISERLIFLISQPRAGSTLLQRLLEAHPDIHTTAEPWIMLHPLYRSDTGMEAAYDWALYRKAATGFIKTLPKGESTYYEGVQRMYSYIYGEALSASGKRYFLDKTPRYHMILPELKKVFPAARFLILLRNPLGVLSSMINTWSELLLYRNRADLLDAPIVLAESRSMLRDRELKLHYEDLVTHPEETVKSICSFLEIKYIPGILSYSIQTNESWKFGDKEGISRHSAPVSLYADKWQTELSSAWKWRLARDYFVMLGRETFDKLGYPSDPIEDLLRKHRPNGLRLLSTMPLAWWFREPHIVKGDRLKFFAGSLNSIRKRGLLETIRTGLHRLRHNIPLIRFQ